MNDIEKELYVETSARNLQEYNRINEREWNGKKIKTVYAGFRTGPTGYKERYYIDTIAETGDIVGEEYLINFYRG